MFKSPMITIHFIAAGAQPIRAQGKIGQSLMEAAVAGGIPGLAADHPALRKVQTTNHTVCADQMPGSLVMAVYEYPPLAQFLAATMRTVRSSPYA